MILKNPVLGIKLRISGFSTCIPVKVNRRSDAGRGLPVAVKSIMAFCGSIDTWLKSGSSQSTSVTG